jgi:serine/threonine-protein kinase RsbW
MSELAPDVRMTLPARPEGVAVVRQALAGMADALDVDATVLADMKMAVSEACTNVVVHAYEDGDGMLEVDMMADDAALTIRVRDHGSGIQPHPRPTRDVPALGLGLPLIAALTDAFELQGSAGRGTEVRMTFKYARDDDPADANPVHGAVGSDGRWDPEATHTRGQGTL